MSTNSTESSSVGVMINVAHGQRQGHKRDRRNMFVADAAGVGTTSQGVENSDASATGSQINPARFG